MSMPVSMSNQLSVVSMTSIVVLTHDTSTSLLKPHCPVAPSFNLTPSAHRYPREKTDRQTDIMDGIKRTFQRCKAEGRVSLPLHPRFYLFYPHHDETFEREAD
jgi:hypothetical protein